MVGHRVSRIAVGAGWAAGALGVLGLIAAYAQRDADAPWLAVAALALAAGLALVSTVLGVSAARAPGLHWPEGLTGSWPGWPWWWVVGAVGVLKILAAPLVDGWFGVLGVVFLGAACIGLGRDLSTRPTVDRGVVQAARRLHGAGGATAAAVHPVGALGARVTAFDGAGRLADVVVSDAARAELAVQLAGLEPAEPAELHPPLRTG